MDILIEFFIEVFGELIITLIAEGVGDFARILNKNNQLRKWIKILLTYVLIGLTILLITLSLIYSKTFLLIIATSYMLLTLISKLLIWINNDLWKKKSIKIILEIFKRIIHYTYPILLIIFGSIYLIDGKAIVALNIISILALITWFAIDMFKLWKYKKIS